MESEVFGGGRAHSKIVECVGQFDFKKENVTEEAIMRVVYLDPNKATSVSNALLLSSAFKNDFFEL